MIEKDLQKEWREWLGRKLDERGRGAKGELSLHLKIHQNAITNILKSPSMRGYRAIKAAELIKMAEFFNEIPPGLLTKEACAERNELMALYEQATPEQQHIILSLLKSLVPQNKK